MKKSQMCRTVEWMKEKLVLVLFVMLVYIFFQWVQFDFSKINRVFTAKKINWSIYYLKDLIYHLSKFIFFQIYSRAAWDTDKLCIGVAHLRITYPKHEPLHHEPKNRSKISRYCSILWIQICGVRFHFFSVS